MNSQKILLIIRGLPSTGKSMLAETIASLDSTNVKRLSLDTYRIVDGKYFFHKDLIDRCISKLQTDLEVELKLGTKLIIIDNTHTRLSEFEDSKIIGIKYGYKIMVINTEYESFDLLCERSSSSEKAIPRKKMEWIRDRWQYAVDPKPFSWYWYRVGKFLRKIKRSISGGRKTS